MTKERESRLPPYPEPIKPDEEKRIGELMDTRPATRIQAEIEVLGRQRAEALRAMDGPPYDLIVAPRPAAEKPRPPSHAEIIELLKNPPPTPTEGPPEEPEADKAA